MGLNPEGVNTREIGYQSESTGYWTDVLNPAELPELRWPQYIDVYDRMRRTDDQVLSVLRAVNFPIRSTKWRIDGTGCRPEVAQHIADDLGLPVVGDEGRKPLRTRNRFDWDEHLRLVLLKHVFGHSVFEQVYTPPPESADGLYHLRKLAWRPPRTIEAFEVADDGGLVSITQHGIDSGRDRKIPVGALVMHVNDREGANWQGQSLLRSAWQFWRLKQLLLKVQAQTVERNGMGVNVYSSPDLKDAGATPEDGERLEKEDRAAGLKMARGLRAGTTTGAAIPFGAKLESIGVTGELPSAEEPLNRYDAGIARSVLAHFLTLGGDDSTGSYALGDTFAQFFTGSLQAVAKEIAGVIQQHVIEDMVDANWGTEEPAPRLVFDTIGEQQALSPDGIRSLLQSGAVEADDETEKWIRSKFGMPMKDFDTRRPLQKQTAPTTTDPNQPPEPDAKPGEQETP